MEDSSLAIEADEFLYILGEMRQLLRSFINLLMNNAEPISPILQKKTMRLLEEREVDGFFIRFFLYHCWRLGYLRPFYVR